MNSSIRLIKDNLHSQSCTVIWNTLELDTLAHTVLYCYLEYARIRHTCTHTYTHMYIYTFIYVLYIICTSIFI